MPFLKLLRRRPVSDTGDVKKDVKDTVTFINRELLPFLQEFRDTFATTGTETDTDISELDSRLDAIEAAPIVTTATTAALSNEKVATLSTEVAPTVVGSAISWVLNSASVILGKLQNISTQRIIGRDTAGTGSPEQITVHQALDWITSDEWTFDGTNDAVSMGNVLQYERNNTFSVSYWIKTGLPGITGVTDFVVIGNSDSTANNRGWVIYVHLDGLPHFQISNVLNSNGVDVVGNILVNDGQLHHVVCTYNGNSAASGVEIYVDGALVSKSTVLSPVSGTIVAAGNSLRIGSWGANSSLFFPGVIKHVSTWDSALSAGNVTTLYNSGTPGDLSAVAFVSNLDAWWKLDSSDTTSASGINDYGPSNLDGTTEGGLSLTTQQGSFIVKGSTDWDYLKPGAKGSPLVSTGGNTAPSFGVIDLFGIESQLPNTVILNNTANRFPLTALALATNTVLLRAGSNIEALAVGTNTVLGRVAGNIVSAALVNAQIDAAAAIALSKLAAQNANTIVANATAGSAVPTAVAVGTNVVVGRVAGNIVAATLVDAQVSASAAIAISKLANGAALTVVGNATNGSAAHTDIAATATSGAVLRESGSTIGFGTVAAAGLANTIISPAKLAVEASSIACMFSIRVACAAGTIGTADDVTIYSSNAPFAFLIIDCLWLDATAIALSSVQLRDTAGGGGAALSSVLTSAVTGTARNNDTQTRAVAANGSVFLRRSDRGVAGEIVIICIKT